MRRLAVLIGIDASVGNFPQLARKIPRWNPVNPCLIDSSATTTPPGCYALGGINNMTPPRPILAATDFSDASLGAPPFGRVGSRGASRMDAAPAVRRRS